MWKILNNRNIVGIAFAELISWMINDYLTWQRSCVDNIIYLERSQPFQ